MELTEERKAALDAERERVGKMDGVHFCEPGNPWKPGMGRALHYFTEEGEQRDGWPSGDTVDVRCLTCGHRWTTELPQ